MKRRSFIGSLLAMIPAALALPRIPKPAPVPEEFPIVEFNDQYFAPSEMIVARTKADLEIGDPVFINVNGKVEKYTMKQGNMVFGYVTSKNPFDNNVEIMSGGI